MGPLGSFSVDDGNGKPQTRRSRDMKTKLTVRRHVSRVHVGTSASSSATFKATARALKQLKRFLWDRKVKARSVTAVYIFFLFGFIFFAGKGGSRVSHINAAILTVIVLLNLSALTFYDTTSFYDTTASNEDDWTVDTLQ